MLQQAGLNLPMMTISLNDLQFEAFHGVHADEKILGNTFIVDCFVKLPEPEALIDRLEQTVDYQVVYEIIKNEMEVPTPLLETVCMKIERSIRHEFPLVVAVSVSIKKLHPPIPGFIGSSSVTWNKEY